MVVVVVVVVGGNQPPGRRLLSPSVAVSPAPTLDGRGGSRNRREEEEEEEDGGGATLRGTKTHGEVSKSAVLRRVILLYLTSWAATGKLEGITTTTRRGEKKRRG